LRSWLAAAGLAHKTHFLY